MWRGRQQVVHAMRSSARRYSEIRNAFGAKRQLPWASSPAASRPSYPSAKTSFPLPKPQFRKTHIEWMLHHGHGDRLGKYGPSREIADFEYADGTPPSISPRRFSFAHHKDHLLVQLIRAGAAVERYEREGLLPRVPGTPEQRAWDPEIPLFLEDMDERGQPPRPRAAPLETADVTAEVVNERFTSARRSPINHGGGQRAGEPLEANTMFASYDPQAFVSDDIVADRRRPHWSRRRWSLSDNFMVPISPKPKNTIKDE